MPARDDIIQSIQELNKKADTEFLEQFTTDDLQNYLEDLMKLDKERTGNGRNNRNRTSSSSM